MKLHWLNEEQQYVFLQMFYFSKNFYKRVRECSSCAMLVARLTYIKPIPGFSQTRRDIALVHKQSLPLNFLCQVQICIAVRDFLENFLAKTVPQYTALLKFARAYHEIANIQNALFSLVHYTPFIY